MTFYSIYSSSWKDCEEYENDTSPYVFSSMDEALKALKTHKDGRLKTFSTIDDAIKYAQTGFETMQVKYLELKSPSACEKSLYRAPTKQELIQFRKTIEENDSVKCRRLIWDNPRYLINCGDTPTSLKDGYRYNALHICAIHNKSKICDLILSAISSEYFISLLHGKENTKICQEVSEILLDYYLNMPEKGRSETPLHLAAKYGAVEIVEILTSYPQCKMTPNGDNQLPKDLICSRMTNASEELKEKIESLLQERFYVPVIRSVDNSVPPSIGEPFSPTNPPNLNTDLLSPELKIEAFAGPMTKDQAENFRRRWKTPPRMTSPNKSILNNSPHISPIKVRSTNNFKMLNKTKLQFSNIDDDVEKTEQDTVENEDIKNGNSKLIVNSILQKTPEKRINDINSILNIEDQLDISNDSDNNNCSNESKKSEFKMPKIANSLTPIRRDLLIKDLSSTSNQSEKLLDLNNGNNSDNTKENEYTDESPQKPDQFKVSRKMQIMAPLTPLRNDPKKKDLFSCYRDRTSSPVFAFDVTDGMNDSSFLNNSDANADLLDTPGLKERHMKLSDPEKGLELIGRELANDQHVEWNEYWDFLKCFINIASKSGLEKLESFLSKQVKESNIAKLKRRVIVPKPDNLLWSPHGRFAKKKEETLMNNLCNALNDLDFCKDNNFLSINSVQKPISYSQDNVVSGSLSKTTPYLCVEKSLQVFAKRCTKTILNNIDSVTSINDTFLLELKRLKTLISSFKDDDRFVDVNFTHVHSRFANLISSYLKYSQDFEEHTIHKITQCFQQILQSKIKNDKTLLHSSQLRENKKEQIQCFSELLLKFLNCDDPKIQPENLKTENICAETWCNELKCDCLWKYSLTRHNGRKRRLFDDGGIQNTISNIKDKPLNNFDTWRETDSNDISSANDFDDSDEDIFLSDLGSGDEEEERFYTPPESPTQLDYELEKELNDYDTYLLGNEPTKRDLDVINAIFNVEITKDNFPNIYRWRAAVLRHSNEERDNFPSPSVIEKKNSVTDKLRNYVNKNDRSFAAKKLFKTTTDFTRLMSSPHCFREHNGPESPTSHYDEDNFINYPYSLLSSFENSSLSSPGSTKNLSLINISDHNR